MRAKIATVPADGYFPRIADGTLRRALRSSGAVYIRGPKWCGKTATGERHSASQVFMQDPDRSEALLFLADSKPSAILEGEEPRLIDEWQMAPQLWDAVRFAIDRGHGRGRFILTGSSTPKQKPAHSGVGRIASLRMDTMSLYETGESSGLVSLSKLFALAPGDPAAGSPCNQTAGASSNLATEESGSTALGGLCELGVDDYAYAICRGGWPEAITETDKEIALSMALNYVQELIERDVAEMDGKVRNSNWMRSLMRSYARNVSTEASVSTIAADMQGYSPTSETIADYLDALKRACVVDDLEAWNPSLRSKTAVRTTPTRHFCDPSIAAAMLGVSPSGLLEDFETFGLLFESLCVHDLRVYANALGGSVYHYRDKTGLEADAVLCLRDGSWAPIEVKLGNRFIDEAAKHLIKLANRIDCEKHGRPSFLLVLTATPAAYVRDDGVVVAPLGLLGP